MRAARSFSINGPQRSQWIRWPFERQHAFVLSSHPAERGTVLVVDDEPDIRDCICEVLEMEGYQALPAEDGKRGLEALDRVRPRLVLLDVSMPIMDGHEFMQRLRARPELNDVPVVIMTAGKASPPGAVGFLQKPCEVGALLECVARHAA